MNTNTSSEILNRLDQRDQEAYERGQLSNTSRTYDRNGAQLFQSANTSTTSLSSNDTASLILTRISYLNMMMIRDINWMNMNQSMLQERNNNILRSPNQLEALQQSQLYDPMLYGGNSHSIPASTEHSLASLSHLLGMLVSNTQIQGVTSASATAPIPQQVPTQYFSHSITANGNNAREKNTASFNIASNRRGETNVSNFANGSFGQTFTNINSSPRSLAHPNDKHSLSLHQQFLRLQITLHEATIDDVTNHTRGRNKAVTLGQVGIQCRHCSQVAHASRQKGSLYFPANTMGLYQAAQNMSSTHIQCGSCRQMPDSMKDFFIGLIATKSCGNGAGRPYWDKCAKEMGLVNTENGIYFAHNVSAM